MGESDCHMVESPRGRHGGIRYRNGEESRRTLASGLGFFAHLHTATSLIGTPVFRQVPGLLVAATMIIAAACLVEGDVQTADVPAETTSAPVALIWILTLGDSYTVGERVGKLKNWPAQLVRKLRIQGRAAAEPKVIAATGWDTFRPHSRDRGRRP